MIKLKELLFGKPDCGCGCGDCSGTTLNEGVKVSENLQYHLDNKISLGESIFRISSNAHVKLFAETRKLWEAGKMQLSEADEYYMHTDAGRQGMYGGKLVPLDLPYIMESSSGPFVSKHPWAYGPDDEFGRFTYSDEMESLAKIVADKMGGEVEGYGIEDGEIIVATNGMEYIVDRQGNVKPNSERPSFTGLPFTEAKKPKKKNPPLNKPKRGGPKAYYVYVRDPRTKKIKKVTFGSGGLKAKIGNKEASQAFAKRHDCKNKKDRTKASYWSCNLPRYHKQLGLATPASTFW
jgi:hypothetical protein